MSNMSARVYVGRLSYRASERDIEHFFRGYGRIRDIVLKNGFGFVVSDSYEFSRSLLQRRPNHYFRNQYLCWLLGFCVCLISLSKFLSLLLYQISFVKLMNIKLKIFMHDLFWSYANILFIQILRCASFRFFLNINSIGLRNDS
ncbi:unnamed protein product [Onchocerca flexuosa]|uniref:RRM domain-containing protein n=1 Tax=Onchocerca flexuosa TaxID=387005 RepID=A0A183I472_9BILA|nr:unnamed protein product [Onchocerca flexuosa]